jgi:hypothetical protein
MPMRGELAPPKQSEGDSTAERSAWVLIAFCAIGLAVALSFAVYAGGVDSWSLIVHYNPG